MVIFNWTWLKNFPQVFHTSENYSESVHMTKYKRIFDFKPHVYLPYLRSYGHFLNYKMYTNVLKTHFLNAQYSLENVRIASKFSFEIVWLILWNGHFKNFLV